MMIPVLSFQLLYYMGCSGCIAPASAAVVPVAHVVMTASLTASPDPAYYGSRDPLTLP